MDHRRTKCRKLVDAVRRWYAQRELRFPYPEEANYTQGLQVDLALVVMTISFCIVLWCFSKYPEYAEQRNRTGFEFHWSRSDPRSFFFGFWAFTTFSQMFVVALCVSRYRGRVKRLNFEYVALVAWILLLLQCFGNSEWHVAKAYGVSPVDAWGQHDFAYVEMNSLLGVVTNVTVGCQVMPVRTHMLFLLPLVCAVTYPLATFSLGSSMPQSPLRTAMILASLCMFAHEGARRHEILLRSKFRSAQEVAERELVARGLEAMSWLSCDITLRLDADGCVLESGLRQDGFFGRAMYKQALSELMPEDDQQLLKTTVHRAKEFAEVQSMPASFELPHATLRVQLAVVSVNAPVTAVLLGVSQVELVPKTESRLAVGLDTIAEEGGQANDPEVRTTASEWGHVSMATSTPATERVFRDIDRICSRRADLRDPSVRAGLEHVAEIGVREHWLVSSSEIQVLSPVVVCGEGGFGIVVMGRFRGTPAAIKMARPDRARGNPKLTATLCNEIRLLRRVRHPHIVPFLGAAIDPESGELATMFDLIEGVIMDDFVHKVHQKGLGGTDELSLMKVLVDVGSALAHLHGMDPTIVHGDVKGNNIKVSFKENGIAHATLLDFGLSRLLTKHERPLGGTTRWMAPELLVSSAVHPAPSADVYSFGLLAHFTMTGVGVERSYDSANSHSRFARLAWPEYTPQREDCRGLTKLCLQHQPSKRPGMVEVADTISQWIAEGTWTYAELGMGLACTLATAVAWDEGMVALRKLLEPFDGEGAESSPQESTALTLPASGLADSMHLSL